MNAGITRVAGIAGAAGAVGLVASAGISAAAVRGGGDGAGFHHASATLSYTRLTVPMLEFGAGAIAMSFAHTGGTRVAVGAATLATMGATALGGTIAAATHKRSVDEVAGAFAKDYTDDRGSIEPPFKQHCSWAFQCEYWDRRGDFDSHADTDKDGKVSRTELAATLREAAGSDGKLSDLEVNRFADKWDFDRK
jgi:hypothetical protein